MKNVMEILEKDMERFDYWIEKSDQKASYILAMEVLILVAVVFQADLTIEELNFVKILKVSLAFFTTLCFSIGGYFAIKVLKPSIKENDSNLSILYFNDIKNMGEKEIKAKLNKMDEISYENEMVRQVKQLANITSKKMKNVNNAINFVVIGGLLLLAFEFVQIME